MANSCSHISFFFLTVAWIPGEKRLLLGSYAHYSSKVGPLNKFRSKRDMFGQTARDIFRVLGVPRTAVLCETRFKTIGKLKRSEDKNNRTSDRALCRVSCEEFATIKGVDDSLEP